MPTYQYRCNDCGSELEAVQKFTDAALTECPTCDGSLRKVFNAVGVVFKGSGFYRTDSRADQKKPGSSGAGSKSDKSDSSRADSAKSDGAGEKKSSTTEKKTETSGSKQPVTAGSSSGSGSSGGSSSTAS